MTLSTQQQHSDDAKGTTHAGPDWDLTIKQNVLKADKIDIRQMVGGNHEAANVVNGNAADAAGKGRDSTTPDDRGEPNSIKVMLRMGFRMQIY